MAIRDELSHYILDFALETSKIVTQKEIQAPSDEANIW